jgi:hypothetical protein
MAVFQSVWCLAMFASSWLFSEKAENLKAETNDKFLTDF